VTDVATTRHAAPAIILTGATGATGNAVAHALAARTDVTLAALVAPSVATEPTRSLPADVPAFATLEEALAATSSPTVLVDFTHAEPALAHAEVALAAGMPVVLGATGFAPAELDALGARFDAAGIALFQVPNFSLGAVLLMRAAADLARHFADVEIVELHHDRKRDSPSGTSVLAARRIAAARRAAGLEPGPGATSLGDDLSRGALVDGIPVHALRLPGASAHQEIVFGGPGELVTLRHDVIDRSAYASGVVRAVAARARGRARCDLLNVRGRCLP
jgi:4-hydroxy-tetrahydrodipicolinate reductase